MLNTLCKIEAFAFLIRLFYDVTQFGISEDQELFNYKLGKSVLCVSIKKKKTNNKVEMCLKINVKGNTCALRPPNTLWRILQ